MSKSGKDSLGDRMKTFEDSYRQHLPIRMPVIIRVDGAHFHSYTAKCKKPVDMGLVDCMNETAIALCETVQGCQLAYVQSDEISLLVTNYQDINTQSWFDNNLQKMVSVSASTASVAFTLNSYQIWGVVGVRIPEPIIKPAYFDSRAFVLPKEEVCNYFIWRQQDATRNSVQMLARSLYSHKQLENKNNSELQEMIFQKGINWNDCPVFQKRGRCIVKTKTIQEGTNPKTGEVLQAERSKWIVDNEIPIFSKDRSYIDNYAFPLMKVEFKANPETELDMGAVRHLMEG
jgi:tRNA(His) guanylyltransferase